MLHKNKVTHKTLFFYALPAVPIALLGLPMYIYLPTFYAQDQSMGVLAVGVVLFIARIIDMLMDPFIGRLSDRYFSRQSMMFIGAVMVVIGFYFLVNPAVAQSHIWLFGFSIFVYTGWSFLTIPYFALSSELSPYYDDNTRLASSRELFTIIGVLTALLLPYFFGIAEQADSSLWLLWQTFVILLPIMMLLFLWGVDEKRDVGELLPMCKAVKSFWNNIQSAKRLFTAFLLNNLANAIPATLFLLYVELVIHKPALTGALLLLYFASGIVGLPVWLKISTHWGKRATWMMSMLWACLFFVWIPFLGEGDIIWFALISFLSGLSLGADMALPAAIQSDVAQESFKKGNAFSGVLFGLWAMLTKLALALSVGVSFGLLGLIGFDAKAPTKESLLGLALIYSLLPVLLKIVALYLMQAYQEPKEMNKDELT